MRVIGVKGSLHQSIIQIEQKIRGYRGKRQFTVIIHSKKHKTRGYRGKKQFTAIIHSNRNRAQNTGLSG
jgi:hypothetical protein